MFPFFRKALFAGPPPRCPCRFARLWAHAPLLSESMPCIVIREAPPGTLEHLCPSPVFEASMNALS